MIPEVERRLTRFGVSGVGRDWVMRALHPAGAELPCPGIPDESAVAVMRPQYRAEYTIPTPAVSTATWDCMLIQYAGDVNAVLWAAAPAGTDFSSQSAPPGAVSGVITIQPSQVIGPGFSGSLFATAASGDPCSTIAHLPNPKHFGICICR